MASKRLIVMVGLPRSGKSTACKEYRDRGYPVVARDAVRLAVHGCRYRQEAEPLVAAITKQMVTALFIAGHDTVVVDECNVTKRERDKWKSPHWARQFHVIPNSLWESRDRAEDAKDYEIIPVIERMAQEWEPIGLFEGQDEPYKEYQQTPLPPCGGPWEAKP